MPKADLHTHTTLSDGTLSPTQLLDHAREQGLQVLSITDHDTLTCTSELRDAASERDITLVPGVEFSTSCQGTPIHILGYFVDRDATDVVRLLEKARGSRKERNEQLIVNLKRFGIDVDWEELHRVAGNEVVGRPHFAQLLVEKDVVRDVRAAFQEYLGDDAPCCPPRRELDSAEVIAVLRDCGGLSCLAHPSVYGIRAEPQYRSFFSALKSQGLDALEVYYGKHSAEMTAFFKKLAGEFGFLALGGSDFHGENKKNVFLGKFHGSEDVYENIHSMLKKKGLLT